MLAAAVVGAVLAVLVVVFILQNTHDVVMHFLWADFDAPLWVALAVVFASGAVALAVAALLLRRSHEQRRHDREVVRRARSGGR